MTVDFDVIIVGAGVVGCCIAYDCASNGLSTLLVEKAQSFGQGVSSRSSEVIHAGIYYEETSLKAKLCIEGKLLLYDFCDKYGVPYKRLGKYIIAMDEKQDHRLHEIYANGKKCGVSDLVYVKKPELQEIGLGNCFSAIYSPSTGIVDTHEFMSKALTLAENFGALISFNTEVIAINPTGAFSSVIFADGYEVSGRYVINAAGLGAVDLAKRIEGISAERIPDKNYVKGDYFKTFKKLNFDSLIYPIPEPGGLGIHLTFDLSGNARFGPDVEVIDKENYAVNESKKDIFAAAISQFMPGFSPDDLVPDYAGIRPKILFNGRPFNDFYIKNDLVVGTKKVINLMGIESPGITASLAIAKYVRNLILKG